MNPSGISTRSRGVLAPALAVIIWLLSRAYMAHLWSEQEWFIDNDVRYYFWQLTDNGLHEALIEYPTPIALLLGGLGVIVGDEDLYVMVFVLLMALVDALAAVWIWRRLGGLPACYWALFTFLVGSLIWFRIDLLPAIAVLAGLIWLNRRPAAAGIAIAVGAATKLWPAMLIGPMLGRDVRARQRELGFLIIGGALGLSSLLGFGWQRSVSPLTWQSERGLQIESVAASVPMLRHAFGPTGHYHTELSEYNAWEIYGPGVSWWQHFADATMIGSILLALVLTWLVALGGIGLPGHALPRAATPVSTQHTRTVVLAQLAVICAVIVANKTFSPQYVIWLAGPLAVLVSLPAPGALRRQTLLLTGLGLGTAALTHLVFPLNYSGLITEQATTQATWLLVIRNAVMCVLCLTSAVAALRSAWRVGLRPPD